MKVIMVAKESDLWFPNPSGLQPLVIEDFSIFPQRLLSLQRSGQEGFRHAFARGSLPAHLVRRLTVASQG